MWSPTVRGSASRRVRTSALRTLCCCLLLLALHSPTATHIPARAHEPCTHTQGRAPSQAPAHFSSYLITCPTCRPLRGLAFSHLSFRERCHISYAVPSHLPRTTRRLPRPAPLRGLGMVHPVLVHGPFHPLHHLRAVGDGPARGALDRRWGPRQAAHEPGSLGRRPAVRIRKQRQTPHVLTSALPSLLSVVSYIPIGLPPAMFKLAFTHAKGAACGGHRAPGCRFQP
ncbi:hypothetical protein C2E23DRAFT_393610 [Lenzites betulinus]|nr:hypothetical protein C2E23DRAFT_393610 [Lenzites betulinus]